MHDRLRSALYVSTGAIGLFLVYLFQDRLNIHNAFFGSGDWTLPYQGTDYLSNMSVPEFISAKVLRYLLNDLFAICVIHGLFRDKSFTRFSFLVMGFGLVVLLPLYFFLYLSAVPGYSSMISHLHRLVLNPVLMMLLIPALWHQRRSERQR